MLVSFSSRVANGQTSGVVDGGSTNHQAVDVQGCRKRENKLYKIFILSTEFDRPPNLVRDKGIYSTRAGSILTSAGPAWDL